MPNRLIIAYSLLGLMAVALAVGVAWLASRRGRHQRLQRQRQDAQRERSRATRDAPLAGEPS